MTIDPDVATTAKRWGEDPALLQAIVTAEGDILRAVRCSVPTCADRAQALDITCRTINHARRDFVQALGTSTVRAFVAYLGARWAPLGATNDPQGLNRFWVSNVTKLAGLGDAS